jgi:hypothetical protein
MRKGPGGRHMSAWWWVPIGLAAWLSVSLAVGLLLARFFRHAAQARDALDALAEERPAERQEPPQDGPRVALWAPKRGALRHLPVHCQAPGCRSAWYQPRHERGVQLAAGGRKCGRTSPRVCERLGGPRHSVEPGGIGSREGSWRGPRLLASGAGACEQAHKAGGTCTYGSPAGNHPAAPIASLHMNCTCPTTRLHTGGLSWVDSPGQRRGA